MEALAVRLSHLDSQAEGAIRVAMFYDTLMRRRVDLPALARASAGVASCVTGMRLHSTGRAIRVASDGRDASAPLPPASTTMPITLDEEEIGTVWLERSGAPGPLDELLLDRLAIAATAVVERYGPARTTMADPALVELVISSDSDEAARARALRLLGFAAHLPVHVVAVRSQLPLDQVGGLVCPARPVKAAPLTDVGVILATTVSLARFPAGVYAGVGAAESPDRSWQQAAPPSASPPHVNLSSGTPTWARWHCSPRYLGAPPETTRTWPRSPAWPSGGKIWRPWTPTAPPAPCARLPTFSICTTAASPADSNRPEDPGRRTHRVHRTHPDQARPHRMAAAQRLRKIPPAALPPYRRALLVFTATGPPWTISSRKDSGREPPTQTRPGR